MDAYDRSNFIFIPTTQIGVVMSGLITDARVAIPMFAARGIALPAKLVQGTGPAEWKALLERCKQEQPAAEVRAVPGAAARCLAAAMRAKSDSRVVDVIPGESPRGR